MELRDRSRTLRLLTVAAVAFSLVLSACASGNEVGTDDASDEAEASTDEAEGSTEELTEAGSEALRAAYPPDGDDGPDRQPGPNGEEPADASEIAVTSEEVAQVSEGNFTAAFVSNGSNNVSEAIIRGLEDRFEEYGIDLVATGDGNFDQGVQLNVIQDVIQTSPDVIISTPVDIATSATAYQAAVDAGIKLIFIQQTPEGFQHGEHYATVIGSDYVGAAQIAARLLGDAMGGQGKLGFLFYDANFPFTNNWDAAFKRTVRETFPDIEVVSAGFADPAAADATASGLFTQHSDIGGLYATWQDPLEAALSALRNSSVDQDIPAATVGLNDTIAVMLAEGANVVGVGLDQPYAMAQLAADAAVKALVDVQMPPYVIMPSSEVTADNLETHFEDAYGIPASDAVRDALSGS